MQIQSLFKAGNSTVVSIPKPLAKELGFHPGERVVVDRIPGARAFVVSKFVKAEKKTSAVEAEFQDWLRTVLKEDAGILDELALR